MVGPYMAVFEIWRLIETSPTLFMLYNGGGENSVAALTSFGELERAGIEIVMLL